MASIATSAEGRNRAASRAKAWMSDPKLKLTTTRLFHDARFTRSLRMLGLSFLGLLDLAGRCRRLLTRCSGSPEPREAEEADRRPHQDPPPAEQSDRDPDGLAQT